MGSKERIHLQERLEASRGGRALISAFVVVTLAAVAIANLPAGHAQRSAYTVAQPYLNYTGLDQRWLIFGPVPRSAVFYLEARVTRADGTVTVWRPPTRAKLLGAYSDERWLKLVEHTVLRSDSDGWPWLWPTVARYAASVVGRHGSPPVKVELVRRQAIEVPPGKGPPYLTPFENTLYYTLTLSPKT